MFELWLYWYSAYITSDNNCNEGNSGLNAFGRLVLDVVHTPNKENHTADVCGDIRGIRCWSGKSQGN